MRLTNISKRIQREAANWLCRRPIRIELSQPIVSFTFDDFPRSALFNGGSILRNHGLLGTYYTSFGLMGKTAPTGEIFHRDDLEEFLRQRHEIACHTYDHCHSWDTLPEHFEESIVRNQQALSTYFPETSFSNFSYPISHPRPETKSRTAKHYRSSRGGGQTFNIGTTDLNHLKAFFIEQSRENMDAIKGTIDANAEANGWLIFATHDVCNSPTRFGCSPAVFQEIVKHSMSSGAVILSVSSALDRIQNVIADTFTPA
jgi:peptidoglycan/xylan/chitin deacetylase (PgdA/CDA1 family)